MDTLNLTAAYVLPMILCLVFALYLLSIICLREIKSLRADKAGLLKAMYEIRSVAISGLAKTNAINKKIADAVEENSELQKTNRQLEAQIKMLKGGK